jgi:hypothetical protein
VEDARPTAARSDPFAWKLLLVLGLLNVFRGSLHVFLSDGGAERIAGFDLDQNRDVVLFLFAALGVDQLTMGVIDWVIAFRAPALAVPWLWVHALKQTATLAVLTFVKPIPGTPPGERVAPVVLVLLWAALGWIHWRRRRDARATRIVSSRPARTDATVGRST